MGAEAKFGTREHIFFPLVRSWTLMGTQASDHAAAQRCLGRRGSQGSVQLHQKSLIVIPHHSQFTLDCINEIYLAVLITKDLLI